MPTLVFSRPPPPRLPLAPVLVLVPPPHGRVPVVLDGVVGPPRQQLGDFRPLVAEDLVRLVDDRVLVLRPGALLDLRVEVVVPALAALLADAALEMARYKRPFLRAVLVHEFDDLLVLLETENTLRNGTVSLDRTQGAAYGPTLLLLRRPTGHHFWIIFVADGTIAPSRWQHFFPTYCHSSRNTYGGGFGGNCAF